MSWFKRSSDGRSPDPGGQSRPGTDPNTCLEVFENHWKQAWAVITCEDKKTTTLTGQATADGVEAVLRNLEQMVTLLASEDDDGGLPGPILQYVLESELLERVCAWCTINVPAHDRLRWQQLRLFESIISQSRQQLLVHKPVIKPLLRLLIDVANSHEISNGELEFKLVLVLHQICICISQQNLILESFFSTDTDHGPARFLIFSLLIPYIHREGSVGQKARDALLLIMTLSARHPHIGQYIANNSDFCPVLATGLSGLYSSLPRRITPLSDDWHAITWEDCVRMPDLQMFLNSVQFSNAVVQVAHPLVRDQLIEFIYSGFLVPVLAPALHQISREEVMAATAYLDLFVRHVTEPHLLKATLKFVLTEKYEDVLILDTLLTRLGSNSELSTVTLALFHSLVDLNCEDVMFQLVFRYLVPCTHVMVSQRRSVRDLDLYGKSAEKFLSLRPVCCTRTLGQLLAPSPAPAQTPHMTNTNMSAHRTSIAGIASMSNLVTLTSSESSGSQLQGETSYFEYLHDARSKLERTVHACYNWSYLYDGESPPPDSIVSVDRGPGSGDEVKVRGSQSSTSRTEEAPRTGYIELGSILPMAHKEIEMGSGHQGDMTSDMKLMTDTVANYPALTSIKNCNSGLEDEHVDAKLYSSLDDLDTFIAYLNEIDLCADGESVQNGETSNESFDELIDMMNLPKEILQRASRRKEESEILRKKSSDSLLSAPTDTKLPSASSDSEIPLHDLKNMGSSEAVATNLNEVDMSEDPGARSALEKSHSKSESASSGMGPEKSGSANCFSEFGSGEPDQSAAHLEGSPSKALTTTDKGGRDPPRTLRLGLKMLPSLAAPGLSPMRSSADMSPFRSVLSPAEEFPALSVASLGIKKLNYLNDPPNIGPFLGALFARLEGMASNSLYFNLLLTDVLSRLATYPQPLLRSFLLNHNLVFQPSVRSLVQVLSSLRQKLDNFSATVRQFDNLLISARLNLLAREDQLYQVPEFMAPGTVSSTQAQQFLKPRAHSIATVPSLKERKKPTLSDLIFRRSPGREKLVAVGKHKKQQEKGQVGDGSSYYHSNNLGGSDTSNNGDGIQGMNTWNMVYCALILDEFLKELAALSQEHSVLHLDEGYLSS